MGRLTFVRTDKWADSAFKDLSLGGKILYDYLLTSPVGNSAGYYRLTKAQLKADLCREDDNSESGFNVEDEVFFKKEILPQLTSQNKLWKYDSKTSQVLIPNYLKYNRVTSGTQIKGLLYQIEPLAKCELHLEFFFQAQKFVVPQFLFEGADKATIGYLKMCCNEILKDSEQSDELADQDLENFGESTFRETMATVVSNYLINLTP